MCCQRRPVLRAAGLDAPRAGVPVVYRGAGSLRVTGPATRRVYLFSRPGEAVLVDGRDAGALLRAPSLRRG